MALYRGTGYPHGKQDPRNIVNERNLIDGISRSQSNLVLFIMPAVNSPPQMNPHPQTPLPISRTGNITFQVLSPVWLTV